MSQIIEGKRHDKLHIVFTLISEAPPFIFTIRSACKCQPQHNIIIFRKAYIVRAPDRILIVVSAVCPVIRASSAHRIKSRICCPSIIYKSSAGYAVLTTRRRYLRPSIRPCRHAICSLICKVNLSMYITILNY